MKTITVIAASLISVSAFSQTYPDPVPSNVYNDKAEAVVVYVSPIFEQVVVGKHCQPVAQNQQFPMGAVVGGVAGGVVGSRFGGGSGRVIATAVGAIGGMLLGDAVSNQQQYQPTRVQCTPITQMKATANSYVAEYKGKRVSGTTYRPLRVGDTVYVDAVTIINLSE